MTAPIASYRLQLRDGVTLLDAADRLDHLAALGVSHLHLAPVFAAVPGSTHGYDVVDPERIDGSLGGDAALERLSAEAAARGIGLVVDIVPNHMAAVTPWNAWWWDVLRLGPDSPWALVFDIDWPDAPTGHRVLVPRLGEPYGEVLARGGITLEAVGGTVEVVVEGGLRLPVDPRTTTDLLRALSSSADPATGRDAAARLAFAADAFDQLTGPSAGGAVDAWRRDVAVLDDLVAQAVADAGLDDAASAELAALAADHDRLDDLLGRQHYRLAHWRTGRFDLDYRRFFDVEGLVGVRVEDPGVFEATHRRLLELVADGTVDGLRVDHPDGLRDPGAYLAELRRRAPGAWIVIEKILEPGEPLPGWPVDGTTGYDFLAVANGLAVDAEGLAALRSLWASATGDTSRWPDVLHDARRHVLTTVLPAEVDRVLGLLAEVARARPRHRDHPLPALREALVEVLAEMPVYRTYGLDGRAADADRRAVAEAIEGARARNPRIDPAIAELLVGVLEGRPGDDGPAETELRARYQQLSDPSMAKGKEDTAFYRHAPLLAVNEVGSDLDHASTPVEGFHDWAREARPRSVLVLSTHDTKRSEDVRSRLDVLSWVPGWWGDVVRRWRARWTTLVPPDPALELLVYQTLVGAWPIDRDRLGAWTTKAMREAKRCTSWLDPDEAYEASVQRWLDACYDDPGFVAEVASAAGRLVRPGRVLGLGLKLLQLTAPGVPDVYQGTEGWDLSLVDPDNRRPVDWEAVAKLATEADRRRGTGAIGALGDLDDLDDAGLDKVALLRACLDVRRRHPGAFGVDAGYRPLDVAGPAAGRLVAFARTDGQGRPAVVVAAGFDPCRTDWGGTAVALPPGRWRHLLVADGVATGAVGLDAGAAPGVPLVLAEREHS